MAIKVSEAVSIQTKVHLWCTWLQIAIRETAAAQSARSDGVIPRSFESADSAKLSVEFQCSLTAIAAVAFAMDALSLELKGAGFNPDLSLFAKRKKSNAGFYIGHRFVQAFALKGEFGDSLPTRMEALFNLRNDSVHFESEYRAGTHPHPSGAKTAYELTIYTLEESLKAVQLGIDVISESASSANAGMYNKTVEKTAREMVSVLTMLHEVIRAEGLESLR